MQALVLGAPTDDPRTKGPTPAPFEPAETTQYLTAWLVQTPETWSERGFSGWQTGQFIAQRVLIAARRRRFHDLAQLRV
jgi:hypothetical protein